MMNVGRRPASFIRNPPNGGPDAILPCVARARPGACTHSLGPHSGVDKARAVADHHAQFPPMLPVSRNALAAFVTVRRLAMALRLPAAADPDIDRRLRKADEMVARWKSRFEHRSA